MEPNKDKFVILVENVVNENEPLQLSSITLKPEYALKWNERSTDFLVLTRGGEMIRPTLYRKGGINFPDLKKDRYFMLLKYTEAHYSKEIMRMSKKRCPGGTSNHLEGKWCVIDSKGEEKVVAENSFKYPHIVDDSVIYSIEKSYYNIETGEFYCSASGSMQSAEYLFLENNYDKDHSRRGVMKINKNDGSWELFPASGR